MTSAGVGATVGPVQAREKGLLGIVCALLGVIALGAPASAGATVRFASPTGMNTGTCTTFVTACNLQRAVEVVAVGGDEVIVLAGTYSEADELVVSGAKHVHGGVGQPAPNLVFPMQGVRISGGAVLERVAVNTTGAAAACLIEGNVLLRDSVCWASAANGVGLSALADAQSLAAALRNVTIEATVGPAKGLVASADNAGSLQLDMKNSIVRGTGPLPDVEAVALDGASGVTVALERSNYATESEPGATTTITDPGANSNQTAPPVLASRGGGNFHQLASSPTVDAGSSFFGLGSHDLDGDPRTVEGTAGCLSGIARPDIGADELVPSSLDCVAPETAIAKGPKRKTRKRRASFEFTSTEIGSFQCSLNERPFVPCTSPHRYRKLRRGKHIFNVRAVDLAGNLDASPAERVWKIRAKRKGKRKARK